MQVEHAEVIWKHGTYFGWPANHGGWQRGEEIVVGFLYGEYGGRGEFGHNIKEPFLYGQARSLDNGSTWAMETCPDFSAIGVLPMPAYDPSSIYRFGGDFDHGGIQQMDGNVFESKDFGRTWEGPFSLTGLEDQREWCTTRTCMLDDLVFMSHGSSKGWGFDSTYVARYEGDKLTFVSYVCHDEYRGVMPSVARIYGDMFCALRRRAGSSNWVGLFASTDGGHTWRQRGDVGAPKGYNGNPPALVALGERLVCFYASRGAEALLMAVSDDMGKTWEESVVRRSTVKDIGYPKAFVVGDDILVTYYWKNKPQEYQHIASTLIRGLA